MSESYQELCLKTEVLDIDAIRRRLQEPKVRDLLSYLLLDHVKMMTTWDNVKKYVYYGKKTELVGAPTGRTYQTLDTQVIRRLHCVLGLVTESMELTELMVKELYDGESVDILTWIKELGDPCWYTAIAADTLDHCSFEHVLLRNIEKLHKRYQKPDGTVGFTEQAAKEHKGD